MQGQAEPPLFLIDGRDVAVFRDLASLCHDVEPWMADQPVTWYDAHARPLRLLVAGRHTVGVEVINEAAREEQLRGALSEYLAAVGLAVPEERAITKFASAAAAIIAAR